MEQKIIDKLKEISKYVIIVPKKGKNTKNERKKFNTKY